MAIGIVKGLTVAANTPPVGFVWKSASQISPASIFPEPHGSSSKTER